MKSSREYSLGGPPADYFTRKAQLMDPEDIPNSPISWGANPGTRLDGFQTFRTISPGIT